MQPWGVDALEALRIAILFVGWPGMAVVSGYVLWQGLSFHARVKGSPFGRLVLLMVVGWTTSIGFLAFLATLYLQQDPTRTGILAVGFLGFWAASMALIVWLMHRWGAEAVHINLYYAELAAMDKVKTSLINTVAHELNTPLTPIAIKVAMLRDGRFGPITPEQREAIESIERNLRRLSVLVDQVVLSVQIQTGQLQVLALPTDGDEWLAEAVQAFAAQPQAEGRALAVQGKAEVTLPLDRDRMARVLSSLLVNAVKFSPKGTAVEVEARRNDGKFVVEVRDHGIGFTPEQRQLLFQPMRQAHDAQRNVEVGAGLSLYVARGIVEAHGGRIWAHSAGPGQGATFGFSLPVSAL